MSWSAKTPVSCFSPWRRINISLWSDLVQRIFMKLLMLSHDSSSFFVFHPFFLDVFFTTSFCNSGVSFTKGTLFTFTCCTSSDRCRVIKLQ